MAGIDQMLASHKLNIIAATKPIKQKISCFFPDHHQIIHKEVDNLLSVGFIREVKYPEWLANMVVVPKKGGKWRVCVDYTDLNEACPPFATTSRKPTEESLFTLTYGMERYHPQKNQDAHYSNRNS